MILRLLRPLLLVFILALGIGGVHYYHFLATPVTVPEAGQIFSIDRGESIAEVARRLQSMGIIEWPAYFRFYARLRKQDRKIRAGDYLIETGTKPPELLALLVAGRQLQQSLTIVEGWTFRRMLAAVFEHPKLKRTLAENLSDEEIMARLGFPGQHPEGRFFPDTYFFPAGTTDVEFLQRAYRTMESRLAQAWRQRHADSPLKSPYQALILASIIEKETGLASERRKIAGVFVRRLQKNMRLQADPTVIYGMGERYEGNIRRQDLRQDTPYNTYTRTGLPPTPIAMPGEGALLAAVQPAAGESLYFVANGSGGHVFSKTLREHNNAVREYQLRLR